MLVKARTGADQQQLCDRIHMQTGLAAFTRDDFIKKTYNYFLKSTGIPINFGISVALGFIVGTAIAGRLFTVSRWITFGISELLRQWGLATLCCCG